jgi:hypothetical protein
MEDIKIKVAANITYSGFTYNTPLIIEYKHTGKVWIYKKKKREHFTMNEEIMREREMEGCKIIEKPGYYYMNRLAIPTINASGNDDIWYINNPGDSYTVNKISKYGRKIHEQLSNNINPFN